MLLAFYDALPVSPETFWAIIIGGTGLGWLLTGIAREAWNHARVQTDLALADQAADHGEPTRAQVEAPWLADHSHIQPTPIAGGYLFPAPEFQVADPERAATVLFAASVMADIAEWTGAAS